jgi:hypothetical protein
MLQRGRAFWSGRHDPILCTILLCADAAAAEGRLPSLPLEVWHYIFGFLIAADFPEAPKESGAGEASASVEGASASVEAGPEVEGPQADTES